MTHAWTLRERLAEEVVLGDGGYLFELERRGYVQAGPYTPEVVIEHPEVLLQLYQEFRRAGAEVLQALTFYGSEDKLASQRQEAKRINCEAVRLAREAAVGETLVAGVITLTPTFILTDGSTHDQVRDLMARQVDWQYAEGVDFFIGETFIYLKEALIAAEILCSTGLPVMITMNIGPAGSKEGVPPDECARCLVAAGVDIVGVNCSFDPDIALYTACRMREATDAYVACQPVGYRTGPRPFTELGAFPLALEPLQLTRFDMAKFATQARDVGINYIGGCCGVAPYHVRAMAEALGRRPEASAKSPDLSRHVLAHVRERWTQPAERER
jgi:betaine-homocysteine S-methyltransferase